MVIIDLQEALQGDELKSWTGSQPDARISRRVAPLVLIDFYPWPVFDGDRIETIFSLQSSFGTLLFVAIFSCNNAPRHPPRHR